jgi:hypothetical protein
LVLLCAAVWMLVHPYDGIFHDANLYTLQALARLRPDSLTQDVFLHFGSQDRFTLFSPVYAAVIELLGVDHAAALLTCLSQLALIAAGWCLARAVMPARYALLGVALLIAMPGDYGPGRIFTCIEPFLTPRMGAEACTLAALACAFSGRRIWSLLFIVAASALHPVMAAAGVMALLVAYVVLPRPAWGGVLAKLAAVWILLSAYAFQSGEWGRLDADWLDLASQRSPYLFLSFWQLDDWGGAAVTLTTLVIGCCTLELRARLLCRAAAFTLVGGLALTWLACDTLHLTLFTQMQPWRWQWLAALIAALTLPLTAIERWRQGTAGRTTAVLLIVAWIFGAAGFALIASACALLTLSLGRLKARELRLVFWGGCAVLALALLWRLASNLEFTDVHYMDAALPLWLRRATSFAHDGVVPAAVIGIAAWMSNLPRVAIGARIAAAALAIVCIGVLLPFGWQAWSREEFPQLEVVRFAAWRDIIAPGENVFWGESPLSSWVLLDRPNYISGLQTSGMIFSRSAAAELKHRALALSGVIGPSTFLSWNGAGAHLSLSPDQLRGICRLAPFKYLVTNTDLGMPPVAVMDKLKLYRCDAQARAAAAAT